MFWLLAANFSVPLWISQSGHGQSRPHLAACRCLGPNLDMCPTSICARRGKMNQTHYSKSHTHTRARWGVIFPSSRVQTYTGVGWALHLCIAEWWAAKSIRHVIREAIHLAFWAKSSGASEEYEYPREGSKLHAPVSVMLTWQKTWWKWKDPLQSTFFFLSLSFLLHLLCTINNLAQSLPLCPWTFTAYPCLSLRACWCSLPSSCQPISLCPGWIYCNQLHHRCWFAIIWKSDLI